MALVNICLIWSFMGMSSFISLHINSLFLDKDSHRLWEQETLYSIENVKVGINNTHNLSKIQLILSYLPDTPATTKIREEQSTEIMITSELTSTTAITTHPSYLTKARSTYTSNDIE